MSEETPIRRPLHERSDSLSTNTSTSNSRQNSLKNTTALSWKYTSSNENNPPHQSTIRSVGSGNGTNSHVRAAIRLVPSTPPQLLGTVEERAARTSNDETRASQQQPMTKSFPQPDFTSDAVYSRTPLPTHPSHILLAPGKNKDPASLSEFRTNLQAQENRQSSGSSVVASTSTHTTPQLSPNFEPDTRSPISKVKPPAKKRLHIHKDNKTFSLLQDDQDAQSADASRSPILGLSRTSSYDSLASQARHADGRSNSMKSCLQIEPATPGHDGKLPASGDPISTSSPWNYALVGGLRKVPKTPDLKPKAASESPLPPVPEASDRPSGASHDLSTKLSFQSTQTTTSSTTSVSETSNFKVYQNTLASTSDLGLSPLTADSNYQLIGPPSIASSEPVSEPSSDISPNYQVTGPPSEPSSSSNYEIIGPSSNASTTSSVIHRPYTARSETISESENENYELYGEPSAAGSVTNLLPPQPQRQNYSQESLVVPPLKPRNKRSNESFGYYKQRSRETLRTGSLTSITTVLSQQEASRAIVGSGSLVQIPILNQRTSDSSSWADSSGTNPPRSHMNEHPHQWSSQLSTVLSVSEGETGGRLSRDWASVSGRSSGAFPSTPSRNGSRQNVLSISSSLALEEARSESLEAPEPAFMRGSRRHQSSGSIPYVQDQDEYGDGITDMQDLRARPSRTRLSGFFNGSGSDSGRTNTMRSTRSTSSSRANSLIGPATIPTWARLYYGSGEKRYLGAPGSATESMAGSRASSFRSGSPNTDHFPLNIYSPRRRPREGGRRDTRSSRGSMEIQQAPRLDDDEPHNERRFKTWSITSVWSPHLRMDRRATRFSRWDPPSVSWSDDGSSFGRRNIQIIMFVIGFIFPFAWMIAAVLPLPRNPIAEMRELEAENSSSQLDATTGAFNEYNRQSGPIDEKRFENAKWWRNLNRWMSLVGVLIIAAIVILVVVSIKQGWHNS